MQKIGQRFKLTVKAGNVQAGTIGTLFKELNDTTGIIQYDFKDDQPKYAGVPLTSLMVVSDEEVQGIPYQNLVNSEYHIGRKFRTEKGYKLVNNLDFNQIVEITNVTCASNMNDDIFDVVVTDGKNIENHTVNFATLSSALFISYNENVEEMLGTEITVEEGEYLDFQPGVRVKFKQPYKYEDSVYDKLFGTVMDVSSGMARVWININKVDHVYVPLVWLYPVSEEELREINPEQVIDPNLLPGKIYVAGPEIQTTFRLRDLFIFGEKVEIIKVDHIATNVVNDIFVVKSKARDYTSKLSTYNLRKLFKLWENKELVTENIQEESEEKEMKQAQEVPVTKGIQENGVVVEEALAKAVEQEDEVVIHSLSINGFQFSTNGELGKITSNVDITKDNVDLYIRSLQRLKTFL